MKAIITVKCPDCGGTLEIDVARERVLSHRAKVDIDAPEKDKSELFDDVVQRVKKRRETTEKLFEAARETVARREDEIDELFGEVKKKIAEEKEKGIDPDDDPRRLFWD